MATNKIPAAGGNAGGNRPDNSGRPAGGLNLQLNPERAPVLIAKWQKLLGKDLKKIEVSYEADGVSVTLYGMDGSPFHKGGKALSIPEFRELKQKESAPSANESLTAFKDKFELRLNLEFPKQGPASGSEADIRSFLDGLPFHQRRAMLMSNKQFKAAYPNGFTQA